MSKSVSFHIAVTIVGIVISTPSRHTQNEISETVDTSPDDGRCAQNCALSLRTSVLAILGAQGTPYTSLLAPFHHILSHADDARHALRKSEFTCNGVLRFEACLQKCVESKERSTWMNSIGHWILFCSYMKKSNSAVMEYMHCERNHMHKVRRNCGMFNVSPQSSFEYFCRQFAKYQKCYNHIEQRCSAAAMKIKQDIDDAIESSYNRLMKLHSDKIRIPNKCTAWHAKRHHTTDEEDYEIEETSVEPIDVEERTEETQIEEKSSYHRSASTRSSLRIPVLLEVSTELPPIYPTPADTDPPISEESVESTAETVDATTHYHENVKWPGAEVLNSPLEDSGRSLSIWDFFPFSLLNSSQSCFHKVSLLLVLFRILHV